MPMQKKRPVYRRAVATKCSFCEKKIKPDYRNFEVLKPFLTERGKLLGRSRTGVCQKCQRQLTIAIKRARHLARLPFVANVG